MKWLRKILGLCEHKWIDVHPLDIVDYHSMHNGKPERLQSFMVQNCEVCNNYRRVKM